MVCKKVRNKYKILTFFFFYIDSNAKKVNILL